MATVSAALAETRRKTHPQRLCVICRCAWAAGDLHTSPDGVRLWRPAPACAACLKEPYGWPRADDPNLKGTALGTLGHTVFAVARNGCGDNLGAFTTTEVNPGNVGGGIFFDGSVITHPKLAVEPQFARATHFLSWEAVCIDGFALLDLYKWHQAQLVNSGGQQPLLVLKKPAYVWPGLRRPYLTCGTGQNPVFRAGSELRWSYIIQEDKQIAAAPDTRKALGDREDKGPERRLRSAMLPNRAGKKGQDELKEPPKNGRGVR
eukprot:g72078.t1